MIYTIKVVGMIKNIHIGNYALIDKTNIELEKGFTILPGKQVRENHFVGCDRADVGTAG